MNKLWYIHTVEYSISVKMNELWLHVATQIRNIMMSYKSKSKKKEKVMISFTQSSKTCNTKEHIV